MNKAIFDFVKKLGIMSIIAIIMGLIQGIFKVHFNLDITIFTYFFLGYVSCLIWNWRWFIYAKGKREK